MEEVAICALYGQSFQMTNKLVGVRIGGNVCGVYVFKS